MTALWRVVWPGGVRLAVGPPDGGPTEALPPQTSIDVLLNGAAEFSEYRGLPTQPLPHGVKPPAPLEGQEVWASGVTFIESRYARESESRSPDFYRDVYFASRPELFFKAAPGTVVGPGEEVGVRVDSKWDVPEPELGLVVDADGQVVAFTLGNDVSSRSIEGANPLYLPQAKVYDASCAVGPCLVPVDEAPPLNDMVIRIEIERNGVVVYKGESSLSRLKRSPEELVRWLFAARSFPRGVVLLTGTGIVPPSDFTLQEGDVVSVEAPGLGRLRNTTRRVGLRVNEEAEG